MEQSVKGHKNFKIYAISTIEFCKINNEPIKIKDLFDRATYDYNVKRLMKNDFYGFLKAKKDIFERKSDGTWTMNNNVYDKLDKGWIIKYGNKDLYVVYEKLIKAVELSDIHNYIKQS